MTTSRSTLFSLVPLFFFLMVLLFLTVCGLAEELRAEGQRETDSGVRQDNQAKGAQLWNERCGQCHTKQTSDRYTDEQWKKIVHHMREKAQLTDEEERVIGDFLRSTN